MTDPADLIAESNRWREIVSAPETGLVHRLTVALEDTVQERDTLAAVIERLRSLLGALDLDSGKVTAPGTAWGSILRESVEALASAPTAPLAERDAHVEETVDEAFERHLAELGLVQVGAHEAPDAGAVARGHLYQSAFHAGWRARAARPREGSAEQ